MKLMKMVLALAVMLTMSVGAYAARYEYADDNTYETNDGKWVFEGDGIDVEGTATLATVKIEDAWHPPIEIISATPATLTTSQAGLTYIVDVGSRNRGTGYAASAVTVACITLPPASGTTSEVRYKFVSGDGSGIIVRPNDAAKDNIFLWQRNAESLVVPAVQKQLRIPSVATGFGATGTCVEVWMGEDVWYVEASTPGSLLVETVIADPEYDVNRL